MSLSDQCLKNPSFDEEVNIMAMAVLDECTSKLKKEIDNYESTIKELTQKYQSLEKIINDTKATTTNLESQIRALEIEKTILKQTIASQHMEQQRLQDSSIQLNTENTNLKKVHFELQTKFDLLTDQKKKLEVQLEKMGGIMESQEKATREALEKANQAEAIVAQSRSLTESLEAYKRSMQIVTQWVPSQKESLEVLIVLSELKDVTLEVLSQRTTIGVLLLKNHVLPRLRDKGFIKWENNIINLIA